MTLFKCEIDRPDCSRCVSELTTRQELECRWCGVSEVCAVQDHPDCMYSDTDPWRREDGNMNCPVPVITSVLKLKKSFILYFCLT